MYITYKPFVRRNEEEEKQIFVSNDLRIFLENHPRKNGDILDFFDIEDLTEEDINTMKKLAVENDEINFVNQLEVGDYIIIEPHTYIGGE